MIEPRPVTYRMLGIDAPNPDAIVTCNCQWDAGHEETCDIVAVNRLLVPSNWIEKPSPLPPDQGTT